MRIHPLLLLFTVIIGLTARGQTNYKTIPLPKDINSVNEEFSGIALWQNRLYLLPQYGNHKETKLDANFTIYSITADSINRVIHQIDTALTKYRALKVLNLNKLPDSVKNNYEGFEAITIVDGRVFLSIETTDSYNYCFLLKGIIDTPTNSINIDPKNIVGLKRPLYVKNAGFEALTYLPKQKKLIALYEFNASVWRKTAYLIDTAFAQHAKAITTPFLYFRITDIATGAGDKLYAINYHYNGDYQSYLNNGSIREAEADLKVGVPSLRDSLTNMPDYLKTHTYAAIVMLDSYKAKRWKPLVTFAGFKNNWEGITLFNRGALMITDANRSKKQVCVLAYIEF
jgi:hypothetical protein